MVANAQPRFIQLLWTAPDMPNGTIIQYELEYWRSDITSFTTSNITNASTLMHTIEGLMPNVTYMVRLRAYTRVGAGPFINEITTTRKQIRIRT